MRLLLLLLLIIVGCSGNGEWKLQEANDIFKFTPNYDKNFTQGFKLSRTRLTEEGTSSYYLGQNFYTPGTKDTEEYLPLERPYAGYLYGGFSESILRSPNVQDTFSYTLGIVGPHSFSEDAQDFVHRIVGSPYAKGWDNQIKDEIGGYFTGERSFIIPLKSYIDFYNSAGFNIGNVFTQGYYSFSFRVGENLPNVLRSSSPIFPRSPNFSYSYYLFVGGLTRAVARNIFLDGNTFRDSVSIDKYPLVQEGRLGVAFEYEDYTISYTYIIQGPEFKGLDAGSDFGELSIGWKGL